MDDLMRAAWGDFPGGLFLGVEGTNRGDAEVAERNAEENRGEEVGIFRMFLRRGMAVRREDESSRKHASAYARKKERRLFEDHAFKESSSMRRSTQRIGQIDHGLYGFKRIIRISGQVIRPLKWVA